MASHCARHPCSTSHQQLNKSSRVLIIIICCAINLYLYTVTSTWSPATWVDIAQRWCKVQRRNMFETTQQKLRIKQNHAINLYKNRFTTYIWPMTFRLNSAVLQEVSWSAIFSTNCKFYDLKISEKHRKPHTLAWYPLCFPLELNFKTRRTRIHLRWTIYFLFSINK